MIVINKLLPIYEKVKQRIQYFLGLPHQDINRPEWNDYWFGVAFVISKRSVDGNTQHGTLLVDNNNHIVSAGYNSFPRKINDKILPNVREPDKVKYKWMIHSEINSLLNCDSLWTRKNIRAYITGIPCLSCISCLWQAGIKDIYVADRKSFCLQDEQEDDLHFFLDQTKININIVKPNLDFIVDLANELKEYGYTSKKK